jgi:ribosomal protein S6
MAYEIEGSRDGIYQIFLFESPASAIAEIERVLLITEEVLRHLVIRDERPASAINDELEEEAADAAAAAAAADSIIDEAESDAAPAAVE